nr:MAG TPA: hypothetical protein [Caudoviricetes sp.]
MDNCNQYFLKNSILLCSIPNILKILYPLFY